MWEGLGVVKTGRVMLGETDPVSKCFAFLWFAIITKLLSNNEGKMQVLLIIDLNY